MGRFILTSISSALILGCTMVIRHIQAHPGYGVVSELAGDYLMGFAITVIAFTAVLFPFIFRELKR